MTLTPQRRPPCAPGGDGTRAGSNQEACWDTIKTQPHFIPRIRATRQTHHGATSAGHHGGTRRSSALDPALWHTRQAKSAAQAGRGHEGPNRVVEGVISIAGVAEACAHAPEGTQDREAAGQNGAADGAAEGDLLSEAACVGNCQRYSLNLHLPVGHQQKCASL
jgi:hypothetical protein